MGEQTPQDSDEEQKDTQNRSDKRKMHKSLDTPTPGEGEQMTPGGEANPEMEAFFEHVEPVEEEEEDSEFWLFDIFELYNNKAKTFDEGLTAHACTLK